MCDVESYCYLPLCEELGYTPAEKYCHQPEMLLHSQNIMVKYGLYAKAVFGTEVKEVRLKESGPFGYVRFVASDDDYIGGCI